MKRSQLGSFVLTAPLTRLVSPRLLSLARIAWYVVVHRDALYLEDIVLERWADSPTRVTVRFFSPSAKSACVPLKRSKEDRRATIIVKAPFPERMQKMMKIGRGMESLPQLFQTQGPALEGTFVLLYSEVSLEFTSDKGREHLIEPRIMTVIICRSFMGSATAQLPDPCSIRKEDRCELLGVLTKPAAILRPRRTSSFRVSSRRGIRAGWRRSRGRARARRLLARQLWSLGSCIGARALGLGQGWRGRKN